MDLFYREGAMAMATQFITRDEYSGGNDQLFLRFSTLLSGQLDLVRTEMRANTANILSTMNARFEKNESDIIALQRDVSNILIISAKHAGSY